MKKIYLSRTDKKICGVCGGLAEYYETDSSLVRIFVIFIALITAIIPAMITYILAAMIIPHKGEQVIHDVKENKSETSHT
jgi:phage shock protein PspC (stress-responsive transcriptional regulator)